MISCILREVRVGVPVGEVTETLEGKPRSGRAAEPSDAGLVLLFARGFAALPSAFVLDRDVMLIGREAAAATIVIPQRAVSRLHARLARAGDAWILRDLESRNGIVVNGRAVQEATLTANAEVRIGDAIFKFVPSGARAHARYHLDGTVEGDARLVTIPGAAGGLQMARISTEVETIGPSDMPVLVLGETGTGKELVAQALHATSNRSGPFRALNCAAIPEALVESELFGYKRGAFSGATRDQVGIVRAAHGGTLLLDEVGDMPLEAQAKLLRMLETREVVPLGAVVGERVDVRVVAATHQDLRALVAAGRFRGDLHARLDGYTLTLPPLRERKEDLYPLVRHFLRAYEAPEREVTFGFMQAVCQYAWPYNVRELAAAVKRAVITSEGAALDHEHLPAAVAAQAPNAGSVAPISRQAALLAPSPRMRRPDRESFDKLLSQHQGNIAAVARELGRDRALIHRWMRALGIDPEAYRPR